MRNATVERFYNLIVTDKRMLVPKSLIIRFDMVEQVIGDSVTPKESANIAT